MVVLNLFKCNDNNISSDTKNDSERTQFVSQRHLNILYYIHIDSLEMYLMSLIKIIILNAYKFFCKIMINFFFWIVRYNNL